jgi:hypothetical protein
MQRGFCFLRDLRHFETAGATVVVGAPYQPLRRSWSTEIAGFVERYAACLPGAARRNVTDTAGGPGTIERPALGNSYEPDDYWGNDAVALMPRELDIPYVVPNPGASCRGLHDSLVNLLSVRGGRGFDRIE